MATVPMMICRWLKSFAIRNRSCPDGALTLNQERDGAIDSCVAVDKPFDYLGPVVPDKDVRLTETSTARTRR
jgi:hypothetical protein